MSRWHWLVVTDLGVTWLLDGLEVTLAGALAPMLGSPRSLGLTETEIGISATAYLAGAVAGAPVFGYATDLLGRKKLLFLTLGVYLVATGLTAFSWNFASLVVFWGAHRRRYHSRTHTGPSSGFEVSDHGLIGRITGRVATCAGALLLRVSYNIRRLFSSAAMAPCT
jgi:MFS family permease